MPLPGRTLSGAIYVAEHVYDRTAIDPTTLREADADALRSASDSNVDELLTADEREDFEAILEGLVKRRRKPPKILKKPRLKK
jgi:hypothetical protein